MVTVKFGEADGVAKEIRVVATWNGRRNMAQADVRSHLVIRDEEAKTTWEVDSMRHYQVTHPIEPMPRLLPRRIAELQKGVDFAVAHRSGRLWELVAFVAKTEGWELTGVVVEVR